MDGTEVVAVVPLPRRTLGEDGVTKLGDGGG